MVESIVISVEAKFEMALVDGVTEFDP